MQRDNSSGRVVSPRMIEHLEPKLQLSVNSVVERNFEGVDQNASGFLVPDTHGAVSSQHVVQIMNGRFRVFDRSSPGSSTTVLDQSLDGFWFSTGIQSAAAGGTFDPRIEYDSVAGRWYAVSALTQAASSSRLLFAVSATSNPAGAWSGFSIDPDSNDDQWIDFPRFGFDDDGVYIVGTMLDETPFIRGNGTHVFVIPKAHLLLTEPSVSSLTRFENVFGYTSGQSNAARGSPGVLPVIDELGGVSSGLVINLLASSDNTFRIDGTITDPIGVVYTTTRSPLFSGGFGSPVVPQPLGGPNLEAVPISGVARASNGKVYTSHTFNLSTSTNPLPTGLNIMELSGSGAFLRDRQLYDTYLAFNAPTVAVSSTGDFVVGMTGSSSTLNIPGTGFVGYPSSYALAGRFSSSGIEFGNQLIQLRAGGGVKSTLSNGRNRWGDYSQTVVDPASPNRFWTFQQFERTNNVYSTQVSQIRIDLAAPSLPDMLSVSDSGVSDSDNLTKVRRPEISGTAQPNVDVRVFANGIQLGLTVADISGNWTVTSDRDLDEGNNIITARAVLGTLIGPTSPGLNVALDTVGPSVLGWSPTFYVENLPHRLTLGLPVDAVEMTGASVLNRSENTNVPFSITGSNATRTISFNGILDNAFYRSTHNFADAAGNESVSSFDFAWLWGEFTGDTDTIVGFEELVVLSRNYGMIGMTYSQGNFDYDPLGIIDFNDLVILARNYGLDLNNIAPPIV